MNQGARLRRCWTAASSRFKTAEQDRSKRCVLQTVVSRVSREMNKRMLCVSSAFPRSTRFSGSCVLLDWGGVFRPEAYLDRLMTLMLACAMVRSIVEPRASLEGALRVLGSFPPSPPSSVDQPLMADLFAGPGVPLGLSFLCFKWYSARR